MKLKQALVFFYIILTLNLTATADAQLYSLETANQRLIYFGDIHSYLAPHVARCFENSFNFHQRFFNYIPSEKITVFLHDFNDFGNAGADAVPQDNIVVGIAPYRYVYETSPANERMNSTMNHEMMHIVAMDRASRGDRFFRSVFFGKVAGEKENPLSLFYSYLTTPRRYAPRWYHEGIAVFMETWMAGGLGRTLGAYDEMVFRSMVQDSSYFYDLVGLESEGTQIDFQVGVNSYLYGTRFMGFIALHYGPEKLIDWISRTEESKAYFASEFFRVFGISLDEAWSEWIKWEHEFQKANLEKIRRNPVTQYRSLTEEALGSVSKSFFDSESNQLYTAVRYPGQMANIIAIDLNTGEQSKICEIKGAALYYVTSLEFDPAAKTFFYTTDNNDWRDLYSINLTSGENKKLIDEVRTGDLAFNPVDRSLWGVRHYNGISTLVKIPFPYQEWNQVYSFPYGQDIFDIDISKDGKLISSALIDVTGKQKLILMETDTLLNGKPKYSELFDFESSSPSNFVFSNDGKYLFGSSYYSGVSNIFRYELENKDMVALSNCETGFFRPLPLSDDSLLVFNYSGKGFIPAKIANRPVNKVSAVKFLGQEIVEKHPVVKSWLAGSPGRINIDSLTIHSGDYQEIKEMRLVSAYPVVEGFKDFPAYGMRINIAGPVGLNRMNMNFSYSPNNLLQEKEKLHGKIQYEYIDWKTWATYNKSDFYDLFGPTKSSRKGYSLGIEYENSLLFDRPKSMDLTFHLSGYGNLERLPQFQNVIAPFDKLLTGMVKFNYQYLERSLGAVDDEKGYEWQIVSSANLISDDIYPRIHTSYDYGIALPINHSSIWLRSAAGYSFGERNNPFANFYFGGFGNNWIDYQTEKRYREYYSFPGTDLNAIGGISFAKTMLEWNLPPLRFRRIGFASLYLSWARLSVFSSGVTVNPESDIYSRRLLNFGSQLDFKIVFLSHFKATFSIGYAIAAEKKFTPRDELMISLKIL